MKQWIAKEEQRIRTVEHLYYIVFQLFHTSCLYHFIPEGVQLVIAPRQGQRHAKKV